MYKKINDKTLNNIKREIKMLLHASRDCMRNQKKSTLMVTFNCNDGYYGEAFGMLRTLVQMKYGYFGSTNLSGEEEKDVESWRNFRWWFAQLEEEVLQEEGFYGDHHCEHCMKKYGKDDSSLLKSK